MARPGRADPWGIRAPSPPLNAGPLLHLPCPEPDPSPARPKRRIGLLGGSFNPAHAGHLHISQEALKRLRLHRVWWLVSPQNPLKPKAGMAPLNERLRGAVEVAKVDPRVRVTDLERRLGTRYTADTLKRLVEATDAAFVWLIGADNLQQLPQWYRWRRIFGACAIAVFDRDPYSYGALKGKAAVAFSKERLDGRCATALMHQPLPAWTFLRVKRHPASSTAIRAAGAPGSRATENAP